MATDLYHPAWCITVDHDRDNGILREVTFSCHTLSGERIFGLDSTPTVFLYAPNGKMHYNLF